MKDYSISAHEELRRLTADQDFNWFVIIGYDSHEGKLTQAYSLQGHPDDWTQKEVAHAAWQLTSAAADAIKLDVENPGAREFKVTTKRGVFIGPQSDNNSVLLGALGFAIPDADKRLWLQLHFRMCEFGISFSKLFVQTS